MFDILHARPTSIAARNQHLSHGKMSLYMTGASREPYYENLPNIFSNMFSSVSGYFSCLEDITK